MWLTSSRWSAGSQRLSFRPAQPKDPRCSRRDRREHLCLAAAHRKRGLTWLDLLSVSRIVERSLGNQKHFGAALGVDVVVDTIGAVGFGHGDIHLLSGFLGGADEKAGF